MEGVYFSAVILIINVILWLYFYSKFKKTYSPEKVLKSIRKELDKLFTEIVREAEEDVSVIEDRIKGLKALIAEADERISRAESEVAKLNSEKKMLADLETTAELKPVQNVKRPGSSAQKKLSAYEQTAFSVPQRQKAAEIAKEEPVMPVPAEEPVQLELNAFEPESDDSVEVAVSQDLISQASEKAAKPEKKETIEIVLSKDAIPVNKKSSREKIMELYKLDIAPEQISEMLNIPLNEVQLAINLFADKFRNT